MKEAILGAVVLAVWALLVKRGIPAGVRWMKHTLPAMRQNLIWDLTPKVVDIIEVLGKHYNWRGETKLLKALERLEKEMGVKLTPEERVDAKLIINSAVDDANRKYGKKSPKRRSFARNALNRLF